MITGVLKGHYYTFNNQCPPDFRDHFNFSSKSPAERDRWNHECVKELYNEISCSIWQNTSSHRKVCPHQVVLIPGIVLLGIAWIIAIGGLVYVFIGKKSPPTLKILCYLNFWRVSNININISTNFLLTFSNIFLESFVRNDLRFPPYPPQLRAHLGVPYGGGLYRLPVHPLVLQAPNPGPA